MTERWDLSVHGLLKDWFLFQQHSSHAAAAKDKDKKKNFSFSRRFPFMKSKDQSGSEDVSADERKCCGWIVGRVVRLGCQRPGTGGVGRCGACVTGWTLGEYGKTLPLNIYITCLVSVHVFVDRLMEWEYAHLTLISCTVMATCIVCILLILLMVVLFFPLCNSNSMTSFHYVIAGNPVTVYV